MCDYKRKTDMKCRIFNRNKGRLIRKKQRKYRSRNDKNGIKSINTGEIKK